MIKLIHFKSTYLFLFLLFNFQLILCNSKVPVSPKTSQQKNLLPLNEKAKIDTIITGAELTELYLPLLKDKNIAVVANQTSVIKVTTKNNFVHLVDSLLSLSVKIKKVFAPEHGFRGKADAGELIKDGVDSKTKLPIISLYGKNKKPSKAQLANIDLVLFDIQDVGARFYTYISTLHYVMEACAELNIPLIILDRPNPNAHYIDGPVLEKAHSSFVGMHKVPVVYGMTIGEYGKMINGEQWLKAGVKTNLTVIPVQNYAHNTPYSLPIKPSPNLPNDKSINLYPSLCFFEGTRVSAGRGTNKQFQIYGAPFLKGYTYTFTPQANEGAKYPKFRNKLCYGEDLSKENTLSKINISYLIKAYNQKGNEQFFNDFFTKLAGTKKLQEQIEKGFTEQEIRESWAKGIRNFKKIRKKYLIYK